MFFCHDVEIVTDVRRRRRTEFTLVRHLTRLMKGSLNWKPAAYGVQTFPSKRKTEYHSAV